MEKASTPRNRLTRSSAKQVNTPKNVEQEESVERSQGEEIKHNLRKTRRKHDTKAKTNGDTTIIENTMNNEAVVEDNKGDDCEQGNPNLNNKSQDSPKTISQKTPSPTISRRSLRISRSSTPGPELESSASKKMKRSSSFGKLDLVSTPTNRRGRRAKSESKDFVFTPSKDKPIASLRMIEKIDEVNEGEKSSEDERETSNQETKSLNNLKLVDSDKIQAAIIESVEKEDVVKQSELNTASETSVKQTDPSTHSKDADPSTHYKETDQSTDFNTGVSNNDDQNDSISQKVINGEEILNVSQNDSGSMNNDLVKGNEIDGNTQTTPVEESKSASETSVKQTDPSTHSKDADPSTHYKETDQSTDFNTGVSNNDDQNDSISQKVINGEEILNVSQNDSGSMNNDLVKGNEIDGNTQTTPVEESKSDLKPCSSSIEIDKSPNTTTSLERNELLETGSPIKETVSSNELQSEIIVTELLSKSEYETVKPSVVKDETVENPDCEVLKDEAVENLDCKVQKLVEMNEIINKSEVETNDNSEVKNIEIDIDDDDDDDEDDDDDSVIAYKELNEHLQSIIDEGMEESEDEENGSSFSNSDFQKKSKAQDEAENLEMSKIELIHSSDSEYEERPENSIVATCKDNELCSENEYKIKPAPENNECKKDSYKEQTDSESKENLSNLVLEKDPEISDDHNHQDIGKVTKSDSKPENNESIILTRDNTETCSDQSRVDLIESETENKTEEMPANYFMDSESSKPFHIMIENPHTISIDDSVPDNSTSETQDNNFQDSASQNQCQTLDRVHLREQNELQEKEMIEESCERPNKQDTNQADIMLDKDSKPQSVDNYDEETFDENYEDEELIKSEDGSCDIYKGLSDSGSYVDEKEEGSQFGESVTSELQSGSGESEEDYVTSGDEEEENVEEKTRLINEIHKEINKEIMLSKEGVKQKEKNPSSPITYEKALAIINQNRVKKIDDEEFFDMFTEELNRVSEQSGSDSDIAIVDEYLMEPEEPAKKTQPKSGNIQNSKQPPRLTGPALINHSTPPENYAGGFNQSVHAQHGHPIHTQHSHPAMQRVNYTQGAMYQQFDQNMHLRGQLMYNQYAHPSTSMQDPHMFNPAVAHPDVSFNNSMFNPPHPLCPVSEQSFPPNSTSLKVRTVTDMNNAQSLAHTNYANPDQAPLNTSEEKIIDPQDDKDNYLNMSSKTAADADKIDTASTKPCNSDTAKSHKFSKKIGDKSRTPILDLLGLDEKALKLLKRLLGLNSIKRELMKHDLEWQKKCLETSILNSKIRHKSKYRNNKRLRESDSSSSNSSSEQLSEDSSSGFSKGRIRENSSEDDNREVNIEEGSVYVTFKARSKPRHRNEKQYFNFKKTSSFVQKSPETMKQRNKTKLCRRPRNSAVEHCSKKMAQKQSTIVKSQCGNFIVDPLTGSSQSSDSEALSADDKHPIQELERKMKHELASGKNKLSNMFSQHISKKTKESRKNVSEPLQDIKGPLRKQNLKEIRKLPSEILETLAKEDKRKKRHRLLDSASDDVLERPKKIRKKSQKIKVKSKAADQNYIPCVTGGATEFGLSRLDKDGTLTLAEKAAKFRTDHLYGGAVKRITSKELMNMKKKQNISNSLAKKRMLKKKNVE